MLTKEVSTSVDTWLWFCFWSLQVFVKETKNGDLFDSEVNDDDDDGREKSWQKREEDWVLWSWLCLFFYLQELIFNDRT